MRECFSHVVEIAEGRGFEYDVDVLLREGELSSGGSKMA